MKTKISLTTLMAIAIQVMSSGQSNEIQSIVKTKISINSSTQKSDSKQVITCEAGSKKILATLEKSVPSNNNKASHQNKSETIQQLQHVFDDYSSKAQSLRISAKTASADNKNYLLEQARDLDQKSLIIQFQLCEMNAEINLHHYTVNKITIKSMVNTFAGNNITLTKAYNLIFESEKEMRSAKELREEAKAQPNLASIIGNMGNAEEKELIALSKQNLAIAALSMNTEQINRH